MPLTPADVHNVEFTKARIGRRCYDPDDVDAFLVEVESELARLIEENRELQDEIASQRATPGKDRRSSAEQSELRAEVEQLREETAAAQETVGRLKKDLRSANDAAEDQALQTLVRAGRTAEEHLADARREAEKLLSEARRKAQRTTGKAQAVAESLERDTRTRYRETLRPLEETLSVLQTQIEQLTTFEEENHARLTAYLRARLQDLGLPDEAPGGVAIEPQAEPGLEAVPRRGRAKRLTGRDTPAAKTG